MRIGTGYGPFFPEGPKEKRDHIPSPTRTLPQAGGNIAAPVTKADSMTSLRVAILDDDEDVRGLLQRYLLQHGFEAYGAADPPAVQDPRMSTRSTWSCST
jgi:hypothetical protein